MHCWVVGKRNIQVPCIGLKSCPIFDDSPSLASKTKSVHVVRFVCSECFEANGGHLHVRQDQADSPLVLKVVVIIMT